MYNVEAYIIFGQFCFEHISKECFPPQLWSVSKDDTSNYVLFIDI